MSACAVVDEEWEVLLSLLPARWREAARNTGALKGLRKDKAEADCLRVLLLHLACGYSLRETAARARTAGLAQLSDVAVLKRLRKSKDWLQVLCSQLLAEQATLSARVPGLNLRLIDATVVHEPGPTGSCWRIHYSLRWPQLTCDYFELSADHGRGTGESLTHFPVEAADHLVADRGYSHYAGVQHVEAAGGVVTVRLNPNTVRLATPQGEPFALATQVRRLRRVHETASWPVQLVGGKGQPPLLGRICALRKSQAATARSRAKLEDKARRNGRNLQRETILYTGYVLVFTTAPQEWTATQILEIYRLRWQIELTFKRFKQLAHLGHLPKEDPESAKAWLYGKLFVALLSERLVQQAETLSPWGYDLAAAAAA